MFQSRTLATVAMIAALSAPLYAAVEKVAKIDATVDLSAVKNEQAATFWANLEKDLENAIAARVVDRLMTEEPKPDDEGRVDGTRISVDIREIELATAFERELNLGDAVLVGQVTIADDTNNSNSDAYELTVSLENAKIVVPEGKKLVFSTDMTEAYTRLVEAFADGVVSRLK
ncbi:MAG: Uncharacterized protein FD150_1626 [Rhodobacteraceae bacterium]|nr:MAG: Uncharacterized protein FD150_1626 [Paracoccaceae bacterium]